MILNFLLWFSYKYCFFFRSAFVLKQFFFSCFSIFFVNKDKQLSSKCSCFGNRDRPKAIVDFSNLFTWKRFAITWSGPRDHLLSLWCWNDPLTLYGWIIWTEGAVAFSSFSYATIYNASSYNYENEQTRTRSSF